MIENSYEANKKPTAWRLVNFCKCVKLWKCYRPGKQAYPRFVCDLFVTSFTTCLSWIAIEQQPHPTYGYQEVILIFR